MSAYARRPLNWALKDICRGAKAPPIIIYPILIFRAYITTGNKNAAFSV